MSKYDEVPNLRMQDIIARTARLNLRDTVRVLRSLALVAQLMNEDKMVLRLNTLLTQSARMGKYPAPLHSKPDALAIDACDDMHALLEDEFGGDAIDAIFTLDTDPYFDNQIIHEDEGV